MTNGEVYAINHFVLPNTLSIEPHAQHTLARSRGHGYAADDR